jgi:hypothetical protein
MKSNTYLNLDGIATRKLTKHEAIPYDLLLLADETIEIIDRYAKDGQIYVLAVNSQLIAVYVLQAIDPGKDRNQKRCSGSQLPRAGHWPVFVERCYHPSQSAGLRNHPDWHGQRGHQTVVSVPAGRF